MSGISDDTLLTALKAGDISAFDQLFIKYYKLCCTNAYFYLRNQEVAEEVVQAFFVHLLEKKGYMHLKGDIKGYLYRSVKHRCLNWNRATVRAQRRSELFGLNIAGSTEHPVHEKIYENLEKAMSLLSPKRKTALQLVYMNDQRYEEAANHMGISINSLKTHLKLGLKKLRETLVYPI